MSITLTDRMASAPTRDGQYHTSTYSLGIALRRLADELMADPNRPLTPTLLVVDLQVTGQGQAIEGQRRRSVNLLHERLMPGVAASQCTSFYGTPDHTTVCPDMWLRAFAPTYAGVTR